MGCVETKPLSLSEIENPCRFLLKSFYDGLLASRNNLKYLEPAYYFLNLVLEQSVYQKKVSKIICEELKNFQLNQHLILQQNKINEDNFLKYLLPVEAAFKILYPDCVFDLRSKMKSTENINTSNSKEKELLKDFFLNEPLQFWLNNFGSQKESVPWSLFFEKFTPVYMKIFEKDLNYLPENSKKNDLAIVKDNITTLMRYELETNNDMSVTREGWNSFSFKIFFNFDARLKLIEQASFIPTSKKTSFMFALISEDQNKVDETLHQYKISLEGTEVCENKKSPVIVVKDVKYESVKVGRSIDNDIRLLAESISRKHFQVSTKKLLKDGNITYEYYISNVSNKYVYFIVESEGYLLSPNLYIQLSEYKRFFIKNIRPSYSPKPGFLTIEPEYFGAKRDFTSNIGNMNDIQPYIEIEFVDEDIRKSFTVEDGDKDFTFNIGSGPHDTIKISDKVEEDEEDLIYPDHCSIKYDSKLKCWIIQDKTMVQGEEIRYKTLIRCANQGQYEKYGDIAGVVMRGILLMDKMKLQAGDNIFSFTEKPY